MAISTEESLASKIQKCLNEDINEKEMNLICSLLRTEPETKYGRNVLQKIKNSPLELYSEMSRRGHISENNYDLLLNILDKAGLGEVTEEIKNIIKSHRPFERPHTLPVNNGLKLQAKDDQREVDEKRKLYSMSSTGSSQSSFVSPDFPTHRQFLYHLTRKDRHYSHEGGRKGLVAIINNFTDEDCKHYRKGTVEDAKNICEQFTSGEFARWYEVEEPTANLVKKDFLDRLEQLRSTLEQKDTEYNSFFLFIMSHGDKDGVYPYYEQDTPPDGYAILWRNPRLI